WYGLDPAPAPAWRAPEPARAAARAAPLTWFDEERILLKGQVRAAGARGGSGWPVAQSLATYFDLRGRYDEWVETLQEGLRAAERAGDARGAACMLGLLVDAEGSRFGLAAVIEYAERGFAAYRALPAFPERAAAGPDPAPEPSALLAEARRAGDPLGIGRAVYTQALDLREAGEHGGYTALFEEAAEAFRACGAPMAELWTLKNLSLADMKRGRPDSAAARMARGLEVIAQIGDLDDAVPLVAEIGGLLVDAGRLDEAAGLARETLQRARAHGHRWDEAAALDILADLSRAGDDLGAAVDAHLKAVAVWRRLGAHGHVSRIMGTLARLCEQMGDPVSAALFRAEEAAA
ncbi:hypothetical protein, partial [Actinomadura sp. KC345]|uniref:hypothetical protein n=1 Tax=Actinomadura sp. KC345 TaxID=2530371 RepID=UPI0014052115